MADDLNRLAEPYVESPPEAVAWKSKFPLHFIAKLYNYRTYAIGVIPLKACPREGGEWNPEP